MAYLADSMRERWLEPPDDEPEPYHYCHHCEEGMTEKEVDKGEWGEWCSQKCWYSDNQGILKKWIRQAIEGGCSDFAEVEQQLAKKRDLNMYGFMTIPTYQRFKRAIQNFIGR